VAVDAAAARATRLGGRSRLGAPRRRGPNALGQALRRSAGGGAREGHRRDGPRRGEDGWCALGKGIVGWDTLLPALRGHCELFIFEHDNPSEYPKTLQTSLQLMRSTLS